MESGIYKITNVKNGKIYIGKSSQLKKRVRTHLEFLRAGTHINAHLQNDFNVYGEDAFKIEVIEHTEFIDRQESVHCYKNDVWNTNVGYNIGSVRDYSVISYDDSIELGKRILTSLISKNPHLFEVDRKSFNIPVEMIATQFKLDDNVIYIALKESLAYTDVRDLYEGWSVSLNDSAYLNFSNEIHIENSIKSVSFF